MNKQELLAELDNYVTTRSTPDWDNPKRSFGEIEVYQIKAGILRINDVVQEIDVGILVHKRDQPQEAAAYSGDVINSLWIFKLREYITIKNSWHGRVFSAQKPVALCRILQDPGVGEIWVEIVETDPDWDTTPPNINVITGNPPLTDL